MLSRFHHLSIYTVQFKIQLCEHVKRSISYTNGQNPNQITSRIGYIISNQFDSSRYPDAQLGHSFCSNALKLCVNYGVLIEAKMVHSHVIKLGFFQALSMQNQVLHTYVKCRGFWDAQQLFDEMPVRNIVSWNTVISGAVSRVELGCCYFRRMLVEVVRPDSTTMNVLLRSCDGLGLGRQLHCFGMKAGLSLDRFVGTAIVDLYGKFGLVCDAKSGFDEMGLRDLVSWNVMVSIHVQNRLIEGAFDVFRAMQVEGVGGDEFTFSSLLSCCSSCECCQLGKQLQGLVIKMSFDFDIQVASVLIDMYAKNGSVCDARKIFDGMAVRNLVAWNTMIVGYGQYGHVRQALELFAEMLRRNIGPDELTVASVVSSCGHNSLAAIGEAAQTHAYAIVSGFDGYLSVANALIAAYSKCGSLSSASRCFDSVTEPDLITWTSILSAHAFHGHVEGSIKIFEMMLTSGQRPDDVAFLGILSACCHGGLIQEGLQYFKLMTSVYNMPPSSEHSACVIDLLGRSGLVDEASSIIESGLVGLESNSLGALIGASTTHGHVKLAERAAEKLFELEPDNPVNYTLMSNMYASAGEWNDAARVRKLMKQKSNSKVPGCSWVEVAGKVHTFLSRDTSHPLVHEIYYMLGTLVRPMKDDDFVEVQF